MNAILETVDMNKCYNQVTVLSNINMKVNEGEFVAIMGPSGSGKSTLLYNISGMDHPTSGHVYYEDIDLTTMNDEDISELRLNNMGFIFQQSYLLKNLSIHDNVVLPGFKSNFILRNQVYDNAERLLTMTGILDIKTNDINQVSGGQLQRAAICRAMINEPKILFGDEPTGSLSRRCTRDVMDIMNQINEDGTTVVIATADPRVAARASRIVYLIDGTIHDELAIGPYHQDNSKHSSREAMIYHWLEQEGF